MHKDDWKKDPELVEKIRKMNREQLRQLDATVAAEKRGKAQAKGRKQATKATRSHSKANAKKH